MDWESVALALIGALVGYWLNELRHRREVHAKLIDAALVILAGKPEEKDPLREWAVRVLDHYSIQVPLSVAAKRGLRHKPLPSLAEVVARNPIGGSVAGFGTVDNSGEPTPETKEHRAEGRME